MALTKAVDVLRKENGQIFAHKVKGGVKIFQGALVATDSTGYLVPCSVQTGGMFVGLAVETIDASSAASGARVCRVYKGSNVLLTGSGFTQANVGALVYATDDGVVSLTSGAGKSIVGPILDVVSSTQVWVHMRSNQAVSTS